MTRLDYGLGALLFFVVVGAGVYWMWPNLGSELATAQKNFAVTNARIADDQDWLKKFPAKQREQRLRMQPINIDAMTAAEGVIEERFTDSLAALLKKNHIGFRKLTFDPVFQADPLTVPSASPAPGQPPVPVPGATPTASASSGPGAQTQAGDAVAAATALAVRRRAFLVRTRVEVEIVAPYAQNLETLADISGLPVLTEVVSAKMSRDRTEDAGKNPLIASDDVLYVYRLVRQ